MKLIWKVVNFYIGLAKRIEDNFLNQVPLKKINFVKLLFSKIENKINIVQVSTFNNFLYKLRNKKTNNTSKKNIFSPTIKSKSSLSFIEDHKNNLSLTTNEINDLKEIEECTFKPKINKKSQIIKNENIYNKLYQDSKIYSEKKVNRTINHLKKESEDLTFNPKLNVTHNDTRDEFLKTIEKVK